MQRKHPKSWMYVVKVATYLRLEPRTPEPYVTTSGLTRPYPPGSSWGSKRKKIGWWYSDIENPPIVHVGENELFLTHVVIPLEEKRAIWSSKLIPPTPMTSIWSAGLFKVLPFKHKHKKYRLINKSTHSNTQILQTSSAHNSDLTEKWVAS